MPLLLLDLDNTLLPRDAAFRAWARDFLAEHRLPATDLSWLTTIDGGGYVPRSTVLGAAKRRYGLDRSMDFLLGHYRRGINSHIHCPSSHLAALNAARSAGWLIGIVSNGGTNPQLEKIRRCGLSALVDGWVISEEARYLKPDPRIFEIAAQRCGVPPTGDWTDRTWMVGDHAPADIAGAELTGLRSVWLHHGRPWSEPGYRPTLSAAGLPEAVGLILSARPAPNAASTAAAARRTATTTTAARARAEARLHGESRAGLRSETRAEPHREAHREPRPEVRPEVRRETVAEARHELRPKSRVGVAEVTPLRAPTTQGPQSAQPARPQTAQAARTTQATPAGPGTETRSGLPNASATSA
ncbi:HAD family hydrolase [Kitasatospora sp. NPDC051853]|uniref:HAD family hydrolase n=1 Tax=Kitasatospora sp. NPDC051853 TaxID=3364058 RepID=UPI0037B94D14